ncbi:MAG: HEAT repeat domain-containing protein [Candidatus Eremiobacteraeota bacterium]|nr:HEAT repeat domain-containing protein [Candidatus Eremiobacteraeota bacterium]
MNFNLIFNNNGNIKRSILFLCFILFLAIIVFKPVIAQENGMKAAPSGAPALENVSPTPTSETSTTPSPLTQTPESTKVEDKQASKPTGKQDKTNVFTLAKKLFRKGRFIQARQILMTAKVPKKDSKRLDGFVAVTNYTAPDWYPEDYSRIEKYKKYTIPLMLDIVGSVPPQKYSGGQKAWINLTRIKFMRLSAQIAPKKIVPVLIKSLDDKDVQVKLNAIMLLGELRDKRAVKPLLEYLKAEHIPDYSAGNVEMQINMEKQADASAIAAIVMIRDFSIVPGLEKNLEKIGAPEYLASATILTGYRSVKFLDLYRNLLKSDDPPLKLFAASALKSLGYDDGLPVLKNMFDEGDVMQCLQFFDTIAWWRNADVAKFFSNYLDKKSTGKKFGYIPLSRQGKYPDLSQIIQPEELLYLKIILKLTDWKKITPPVVIKIMKDKKDNFRYIGTEIIGEDQYKPALDYFRKNLDSDDPLMTYYIIWALGRIGDKKSADKIAKSLNNKNTHVSVASAWSLAVMGDDRGHNIALRELKNQDNSISSTALDIIYHLRKPGDVKKIAGILDKELSYFDRITAIRLIGIYKNPEYLDKIKELTKEQSLFSFYASESAYRIAGEPIRMERPPGNREYYGNNVYDAMDYARYFLVYFSLKPEIFGNIGGAIYGDITPLYRYGEFGRVEDQSPANPLQKTAKNASGSTAELFPGQTAVVKEFKGRKALVSLPDGRKGWTFSAGMDITRDVISKTKERMRNDLGCRWDGDFIRIIQRDYLEATKFNVKYTDPAGADASVMAETALSLGYQLTGNINVPDRAWDKIIEKIDTGKKIIEMKAPVGKGKWIFTFDCLGNLESISITK